MREVAKLGAGDGDVDVGCELKKLGGFREREDQEDRKFRGPGISEKQRARMVKGSKKSERSEDHYDQTVYV